MIRDLVLIAVQRTLVILMNEAKEDIFPVNSGTWILQGLAERD